MNGRKKSPRHSSGCFGCTFVLTSAFMPIAMLMTVAFLRTVNPRLENAGRLVTGWPSVLHWITLPLMAPAIGFAAVLILLLSLGEISVPMYLQFPVYPVETLTQFAAFYDFRAATVAAASLLLVTLIILSLQSRLQRRALELGRRTPSGEPLQIALGPWRLPLLVFVLAFAVAVVVSPLGALVLQSSSLEIYKMALSRAGDSLLRSIVFAATSATLLTLLGFFLGYLAERRTLPVWWANEWLALLLWHCLDRLLVLASSVFGTPRRQALFIRARPSSFLAMSPNMQFFRCGSCPPPLAPFRDH